MSTRRIVLGSAWWPRVTAAQNNLIQTEIAAQIKEVVADKGYHTNEVLGDLEFTEGLRTYIAWFNIRSVLAQRIASRNRAHLEMPPEPLTRCRLVLAA